MQTTPHPLFTLPVAGALLLLPVLLQADLLSPARLTPLASDYLPVPETATSTDTTTATTPVAALPPVVVSATPLADSEPAPNLTPASRAELAEQRYFTGATDTLNRYILPLFGRDRQTIALERLREDERLANLTALDQHIELVAVNDPATAAELRTLRHRAFIRSPQF